MSQWFDSYGLAEVHRDLLVGAYPLDGRDVQVLRHFGVERVLNLVEDSEYRDGRRPEVEAAYEVFSIQETRLSLVDFGHLPPERLEEAVSTVAGWVRDGDRVYVHCRAGWQRSAAVAAGAVAVLDEIDIRDALRRVQDRKPSADPLPHQRVDLIDWWAGRGSRQAG